MDEAKFEKMAHEELRDLEEKLIDVDPDDIEVTSSDGVLTLELRDGVRVVINSHRAARQIWMAAVASAWKFSYDAERQRWGTEGQKSLEFRETLRTLIEDRIGLQLAL